jgi:S-adenosylmethionine:tRNA ribosyltransferase-isomerase
MSVSINKPKNEMNNINIADYNYILPEEKIALFPCKNRDESKLLIYKKGNLSESVFKQVPDYLDDDCMLIFNNTRVVQARIFFTKPTGARVELFCLEPLSPTTIHVLMFETKQSCEWECLIGNNKRFTTPLNLNFQCDGLYGVLCAEKIEKHIGNSFRVRFSWTPENLSFAEVLENVGKIPLPPYLKRETQHTDTERYQTIYAQEKGSVAAPTAGLHFTEEVLKKIRKKDISIEYITLHVGAGTFKPVTEPHIENHIMHSEQLFFTKETICNLLKNSNKKIIAVGTTTTRALESLYWVGVKLASSHPNSPKDIPPQPSPKGREFPSFGGVRGGEMGGVLSLSQWEVYEELNSHQISVPAAFEAVLNYMNKQNINSLHVSTSIIITPYYVPKVVKGIITNFHQPQSTLLLLIASFVGNKWKEIYDYALTHDFRFLSYGDACCFC